MAAVACGACGGGGSVSPRDLAADACRAFTGAGAAGAAVVEDVQAGGQPDDNTSGAAARSLADGMKGARDKARAASVGDPKWKPLARAMEDQYVLIIEHDDGRALAANTSFRDVIRPQCRDLLPADE
jgi:hypothetical protein